MLTQTFIAIVQGIDPCWPAITEVAQWQSRLYDSACMSGSNPGPRKNRCDLIGKDTPFGWRNMSSSLIVGIIFYISHSTNYQA